MSSPSFLALTAAFLIAAVVSVLLFKRLGFSAVLGYLAAGVVLGPDALALINQPEQILDFAEFGIVLLMFLLGLELSPQRLWLMRRTVFGLGSVQLVATTAVLAVAVQQLVGDWLAAVVIGLALAQSSTAIAMRVLSERGEVASAHGRTAFGISLLQDVTAVPILALIPLLVRDAASADAGRGPWLGLLVTVAVIAGLILAGRFVLPPLFRAVSRNQLPELFSATALLVVVGTALLMQAAGLSVTLGAFVAGVLLAGSEYRHEIESHIEPYRGLLLGLFFMAIGMSVDLDLLMQQPLFVAAALAVLFAVKGVILVGIGRLLGGLDWPRAALMAALISAGGEFGFVVATEGLKSGLIASQHYALLITIASLSMALTPLLAWGVTRLLVRHPQPEQQPFDAIDDDHARVIIAGFGRVGQIVARMLRAQQIPFTALENSPEQVEFSRRFGNKIYYGDPARADLLRAAHAERAEVFVVATDDPDANIRTARLVKRMYPHLKVLARVRNRQHAFRLMDLGADAVVRETFHSSLVLGSHVLRALGMPEDAVVERTERFRQHDEQLLREQHLVYDDEAAVIASSRQALKELEGIFEADAIPTPVAPLRGRDAPP